MRAERVQGYPLTPKMDAKGHSKSPKWRSKVPQNAQNASQWYPSDLRDHPKGDKPHLKIKKRQLLLKIRKNPSRAAQNASNRLRRYGLVGSRRGVKNFRHVLRDNVAANASMF